MQEYCLDRGFWNTLELLVDTLKPVAEALIVLQGDGYMSKVWDAWSKLEHDYDPETRSVIPVEIRENITELLSNR
jgi:hypothetical protein